MRAFQLSSSPSGAEAPMFFAASMYGLKPVPSKAWEEPSSVWIEPIMVSAESTTESTDTENPEC